MGETLGFAHLFNIHASKDGLAQSSLKHRCYHCVSKITINIGHTMFYELTLYYIKLRIIFF